jgi:pimeloyl-ACP methyl ester carboxylesterase
MMVFQAIRDGFAARAAATVGAFTDLDEMVPSPAGAGMARAIWPDFAARRDEIVFRRSPIRWPEHLKLPRLLMHESEDRDVSPTQTLGLAMLLARTQTEFGAIVVAGGNHTLQQHQQERDRQAVEFIRRNLIK